MKRRDKYNYYLDIAETILERGTCLRRNYGSVIVNNDEIVSTGYTGAPRGTSNCSDMGICLRAELKIPRGTHYELCRSVHSEANAIISASRKEMIGGTLYLVGKENNGDLVKDADCCIMCKKLIINSGIDKVVIRITKDEYKVTEVQSWVEESADLFKKQGY
ncbi:cytidine deaminase [Hathewaya massiliensis]|uniref:cytidine deaminase n=1 Tax=Hathewaya massiliensis TaxID=1964382 RepID=UPI00115953EE|nr:cytidine deaminase [Hathewaya massiliensis]